MSLLLVVHVRLLVAAQLPAHSWWQMQAATLPKALHLEALVVTPPTRLLKLAALRAHVRPCGAVRANKFASISMA